MFREQTILMRVWWGLQPQSCSLLKRQLSRHRPASPRTATHSHLDGPRPPEVAPGHAQGQVWSFSHRRATLGTVRVLRSRQWVVDRVRSFRGTSHGSDKGWPTIRHSALACVRGTLSGRSGPGGSGLLHPRWAVDKRGPFRSGIGLSLGKEGSRRAATQGTSGTQC